MGDGVMQRMSRGRDQWQLNVHGLDPLINVTARSSDEESFQSRKQSSTHEKKGFFLETKKDLISNYFRPVIDGVDGVRRDRDEGDKNPAALSLQARKGFLAEKGHVAPTTSTPQHWRASKCPRTLWNWALPRRMQKRWDLTLSKAPLRSAWRHWTGQASTVRRVNPPQWPLPFVPACRSNPVTPPALSGEELARQSTRTRWTRAASRGALGR